MKRLMGTLVGVISLALGLAVLSPLFHFHIITSAQAITIQQAKITKGAVVVTGKKAVGFSTIFWESQAITKAGKSGSFKFNTTNLPQDCVGELSDGVSTIDVVISGCSTQQLVIGAVLRTGQTQCDNGPPWTSPGMDPCPGDPPGQDGELQKGIARSYTDNSDGTITDNATGLMWEKLCNGPACLAIHYVDATYTWTDAFNLKIATLNTAPCFAGHCDWRLPSLNELLTLADYGRFAPAIDPVFNNGVDSFTQYDTYYLSSTSNYASQASAWVVLFYDGFIIYNGSKQTVTFHVRAVRGGAWLMFGMVQSLTVPRLAYDIAFARFSPVLPGTFREIGHGTPA